MFIQVYVLSLLTMFKQVISAVVCFVVALTSAQRTVDDDVMKSEICCDAMYRLIQLQADIQQRDAVDSEYLSVMMLVSGGSGGRGL